MIYPSGYIWPNCGGLWNPYFGGFGHFNLPCGGAGYAWYPCHWQTPYLYALKAGFVQ